MLSFSVLALYFIVSDFTDIPRKFAGWILLLLVVIFLTGYPILKEHSEETTVPKNIVNSTADTNQELVSKVLYISALVILFFTALNKRRK